MAIYKSICPYIKAKFIILALICKNGPIQNESLIKDLKIKPNLCTKYTKRLSDAGLIRSLRDGKRKKWECTKEGYTIYKDIINIYKEIVNLLKKPISKLEI